MAQYKRVSIGNREQREATHLGKQVKGYERIVTRMGGKPATGKPSFMSRIFDVLQRGQYASANVVGGLIDPGSGSLGEEVSGAFKNAWAGLSGKKKGTYSKVLEDAGVKNKWVKGIGGFAGDVLLDPTTYIGIGAVKAAGKGAAQTAGTRASAKILQEEGAQRLVKEAGREAAINASKAKALATGRKAKPLTQKGIERIVRKGEKAKSVELSGDAYKEAYKATLKETPGKLGLRFAGREIASSEKAYRGVVKLPNMIGTTAVGKTLKAAFQNSAKYPELTNSMRRQIQQAGVKHYEHDATAMRNIFRGLTQDEKRLVTRAIERGPMQLTAEEAASVGVKLPAKAGAKDTGPIDIGEALSRADTGLETPYRSELHGVPAKSVKNEDGTAKDLGEYVDEARRYFDTFFNDEAAADVFRDKVVGKGAKKTKKSAKDFKMDNYVFHFYRGGDDQSRRAFKNMRRKAVGPESPGFTKKRTIPTIEEAKRRGLKPVEEIDDIIALRMGKHYGALARRKYADAVVKEYGTKLGKSSAEKKLAKENGLVKASDVSVYGPNDMYLPSRIADSLKALEKAYTDDDVGREVLQLFDKVQNQWKFFATAANPGHHARNIVGDAWNNWLDGVSNPQRYSLAARLMKSKSPKDIKVKVGKNTLTGEDILRMNIESGAAPGFTSELVGSSVKGFSTLKSKVVTISERREEWGRLAHFIDALKKEGAGAKTASQLEEASVRAAQRVRKWNIDYGDLTDFERKVMKRSVPFYTWSRKNIPLQLEALAMRPGRVAAAPKGQRMIENLMGTEGPSVGGPDVIPKWMQQMAGIRMQGEGEGKNSIYWLPALPFHDITKFIEGGKEEALSSILSQVTPAARMPFEQAYGKQLFSGAPVPGALEYATSQVPMARTALRGGKGEMTWDKMLNYITGLGVHEVRPYQKKGELRRQEDILQAQIKAIREGRRRER